MRKKILTISLCLAISLTGCGKIEREVEHVNKVSYEKKDTQTATAILADIVPVANLKLMPDGLKYIEYSASEENYDFEKLHVKVGDKVKKGDLLVSFKAEQVGNKIEEYKNKIEENKLLINHYENLNRIEKQGNYDRDITLLKRDTTVAELYLEEFMAQYEKCQIRASEDGVISAVSAELEMGFCNRLNNIVTETCGTGNYSAIVFDDYDYELNKQYTASLSGINFVFTLIRIDESEESERRTLIFEPESDMSALADNSALSMVIEKDVIKDVVRVPFKSVYTGENESYVFVLKDNGYFEKVVVEVGERIGEDIIITKGLKGGEQVKR